MPLILRNTLVLCAIEAAAEGTSAITNPATDAVLVDSVALTPKVEHVERPVLDGTVGQAEGLPTRRLCDFEIVLEIKGGGNGGGADPVAPDWEPLMRSACMKVVADGVGHTRTFTPTVPNVWTTPAPPALTDDVTCSIRVYHDGVIYELVGCRSNLKLDWAAGQRVMATFTGKGLLSALPSDVAFPAPAAITLDDILPGVALNPTMTLGGYAMIAESGSIDLGNEVVERPSINAATGYAGVRIVNRSGSATFNPESTPEADATVVAAWGHGWWTRLNTRNATMAFTMSIAPVATVGHRVRITAPAMQLRDQPLGERNGLQTYELECGLRESTGNDELSIQIY